MLAASAEGYASTTVRHVAPSENVQLVLSPASQLSGFVVNGNSDEPVLGVTVRAVSMDGWGAPTDPQGRSNEHGEFRINGLTMGGYRLMAEGSHFRGGVNEPIHLGLAETRGW